MTILTETFQYTDGTLYWKNPKLSNLVGTPAGHIKEPTARNPEPRIEIRWCGRVWQAHRLIWEYHHGPIPSPYEVDHDDCDPMNNRIENLRLALRGDNAANRTTTKSNTSGFKGVSRIGNRFRSDIRHGGKTHYMGCFDSAEEAHEAWVVKAKELHGEFFKCNCEHCSL